MTKMTVNGVTTTKTPGQEQYVLFTHKSGRKSKEYCAYDYRAHGRVTNPAKESSGFCLRHWHTRR